MIGLINKIIRRINNSFYSIDYWEGRYKSGGNSGSGSYNVLAEHKANFINEFITRYSVQSAIEFGCGDGNQLSSINYPSYLGLDVSPTSISLCKQKFKNDQTKKFILYKPSKFNANAIQSHDLSLSLDVIYHLVEDHLFELHMKHLFQSSSKYVIIYSSDFESEQVNHERQRQFSKWVEKNMRNWELFLKKESPYKMETDGSKFSLSDFFVYRKLT